MKDQYQTHIGDILFLARQFCVSLLQGGRCGSLPFHNVRHTLEVFDHVRAIGMYEGLSEKGIGTGGYRPPYGAYLKGKFQMNYKIDTSW